jgi:chromate reductase
MIEIGDLSLYNQDYDSAPEQPPQYVRFRDQIRAADGVLFCTPEYNRGIPGVLKNAVDVGSRPYGYSVFDKKPAAVITASPGAIGGFGANHHLRQSCVFLNMPMMAQPEAYLGNVSDDSFDADGCLKDGPLREVVTKLAHAFHDWIDMIHRSRQLLAEDAAHASQQAKQAEEHA